MDPTPQTPLLKEPRKPSPPSKPPAMILTEHTTTKTNRPVTFTHCKQRLKEKSQDVSSSWQQSCLVWLDLPNLSCFSDALSYLHWKACIVNSFHNMVWRTLLASKPTASSKEIGGGRKKAMLTLSICTHLPATENKAHDLGLFAHLLKPPVLVFVLFYFPFFFLSDKLIECLILTLQFTFINYFPLSFPEGRNIDLPSNIKTNNSRKTLQSCDWFY